MNRHIHKQHITCMYVHTLHTHTHTCSTHTPGVRLSNCTGEVVTYVGSPTVVLMGCFNSSSPIHIHIVMTSQQGGPHLPHASRFGALFTTDLPLTNICVVGTCVCYVLSLCSLSVSPGVRHISKVPTSLMCLVVGMRCDVYCAFSCFLALWVVVTVESLAVL